MITNFSICYNRLTICYSKLLICFNKLWIWNNKLIICYFKILIWPYFLIFFFTPAHQVDKLNVWSYKWWNPLQKSWNSLSLGPGSQIKTWLYGSYNWVYWWISGKWVKSLLLNHIQFDVHVQIHEQLRLIRCPGGHSHPFII